MKILIADDCPLFRDGLNLRLLEIFPNAKTEQTSGFANTIKFLQNQKDVNLLILNAEMQDMPWQEALKEIRRVSKALILIISTSADARTLKTILAAGADGYLSKRADADELSLALRLIKNGETYISQNNNSGVPLNNLSGTESGLKTLTNRQSQVLDLIAQGKSNKQIAYDMGVSESTVKLHINALLRTLHVSNRTQAVVTAQKMGII
ncbi:MAG: response regulator transcription factor [Alphaproteobacteria bacterium]|nr:response regulator transcription factor [Alphaproteobacteria bacterium]MDY4690325.1 response regulator transcription factor [Alphaproteobacteria bacterium]